MVTENTRRWKVLHVCKEIVLESFTGNIDLTGKFLTLFKNDLPNNTKVINVEWSFSRQCFVFLLENPLFESVEIYLEIPDIVCITHKMEMELTNEQANNINLFTGEK